MYTSHTTSDFVYQTHLPFVGNVTIEIGIGHGSSVNRLRIGWRVYLNPCRDVADLVYGALVAPRLFSFCVSRTGKWAGRSMGS